MATAADPLTVAMFEVDKGRQIVILRQAVQEARAMADAARQQANLFAGMVAAFLAGSGLPEFGVAHPQIREAIQAHGPLGVRVTEEGVVAFWSNAQPTPEPEAQGEPVHV